MKVVIAAKTFHESLPIIFCMSEPIREIIFDTETTGLSHKDGDRVIEIGAVELINRFPTGKTFHEYINPEGKEVHPDALRIHGISNEQLEDKPTFAEVADRFMEFFGKGSLIAHNASFDMGFMNMELTRLGMAPLAQSRVIDTLQMARRKFPGAQNSLDALCSRFGIDNSHREKHGALLDSEILADVYIELLGGRQTSLSLDNLEDSDREIKLNQDGTEIIAKRPKPLPNRLTQDDLERHAAFIDEIGDDALWKKLNTQ